MLSDYGICIAAKRDDFFLCPEDLIPEEHSSLTVGLYNVLPAENDSLANNKILSTSNGWSLPTIEYTRKLMSASSMIYYHHLASDERGRSYGEFYLTIKDSFVTLSKALVSNHYAIYLEKALQTIQAPISNVNVDTKIVNGETNSSISKASNDILKEENERNPTVKKGEHLNYVSHKLMGQKEHVFLSGRQQYNKLDFAVDANFPTSIHRAWDRLMESPRFLKWQSFILPAIKKGSNVVGIGPPKSGKTFGIVFAVSGCLAAESNLPRGAKPSVLILCCSSQHVSEVHSLFKIVLEKSTMGRIEPVAVIYDECDRSLVAKMYNGCQILISTPSVFARFLDNNKTLLDFTHLRYLVFDNANIIFDKYFNSVSRLFAKHNILHNRESGKLQFIIAASYCTAQLKKFISAVMKDPFVCITSCLEAALFKSVAMNICVIDSKKKNQKVLDLLGNKYLQSRTVVICKSTTEVKNLSKFLSERVKILVATDDSDTFELEKIKRDWDIIGSYPLLICTDNVLSGLGITNAATLIHYSISPISKTPFNFRFSVLLDNLHTESDDCKVHLLLDENNDIQYISIIKMMRRANIRVPENILKTFELVTAALETKKSNHPICNNIKWWGRCMKQNFCEFRHKIIKCIDDPITDIRIDDQVKVRVIKTFSPVHYSARILSYIKHDTKEEIEFSNIEYMRITFKLQEYYSSIENRKRCDKINVGSICGIEVSVDSFKRVEIIRTVRTENGKVGSVDLRCIDSGLLIQNTDVSKLLQLPEELAKYPVHIVELYLTGVLPQDNEHVWSNKSFQFVHKWLTENVDRESYLIGTVKLHLGYTMWVETLKVGTKVTGYKDLIGCSLKTELLRTNHAIEDSTPMDQLLKMYTNAGYSEINDRSISNP